MNNLSQYIIEKLHLNKDIKIDDNKCNFLIACNLYEYDKNKDKKELFDKPGKIVEDIMVFSDEDNGKFLSNGARKLKRLNIQIKDENGNITNKIEENKIYFIDKLDTTNDIFNYDKIIVSKAYQASNSLFPKIHYIIHRFYNKNEDYFAKTNNCTVSNHSIQYINDLNNICFKDGKIYLRYNKDKNEYIEWYYDSKNQNPEKITIDK